jgi:hypothetical protein
MAKHSLSSEVGAPHERSITLRNTRPVWPRTAELAKTVHTPACFVRVKDQSGDTVILVGIASARRYLNPAFFIAANESK